MTHNFVKANPRAFRLPLSLERTGAILVGSTATDVGLQVGDAETDDFYNGWYISVLDDTDGHIETRKIIDYDALGGAINQMATVETAFTFTPVVADTYWVFRALSRASIKGTATGGTTSSVDLALTEMIDPNYFDNLMIRIIAGPGAKRATVADTVVGRAVGEGLVYPGQWRRISRYEGGANRTAHIEGTFAEAVTSASQYELQGHLYFPLGGIIMEAEVPAERLQIAYALDGFATDTFIETDKLEHIGDWTTEHVIIAFQGDTGGDFVVIQRWE